MTAIRWWPPACSPRRHHAGSARALLKPHDIPVELSAPSELSIAGGTVTLNGLALKTGAGTVSVTGSAGETLDIAADIKELPASLQTASCPLTPQGTISGKVS